MTTQPATTRPETAISLLATATMKAYIAISRERNLPVDADKACANMRTAIKSNLDTILTEWKEATEARMSEGWLQELVKTQAVTMALEALKL